MTIALSHETALREYLENPRWGLLPREPFAMSRREPERKIAEVFDTLGRPAKGAHVLVSDRRFRNNTTRGISYHFLPAAHPAKVVVDVGDCYLASPELCYLQMAESLSFEHLVLLGFNLCGNYDSKSREPVTSVASLRDFARSSSRAPGRKRALDALRYVLDGSRSPMESRLVVMLCFSTRRGGFGLPMPQLNASIPGTSRAGDLCWLDKKLVVEYDSREHHAKVDAQERDSIRRTEIGNQGFRVVTVARPQLANDRLLHEAATLVSQLLGCANRRQWEAYSQKRYVLLSQMRFARLPGLLKNYPI